jgi:hypothetical protein
MSVKFALIGVMSAVSALVLSAQAQTKDSNTKDGSSDVGVGKTGEAKPEDKDKTISARRAESGIMRTKEQDALYDAFANLAVPEKNRVMPWIIALTMAGGVLFVGLKHSFRNRYEG